MAKPYATKKKRILTTEASQIYSSLNNFLYRCNLLTVTFSFYKAGN